MPHPVDELGGRITHRGQQAAYAWTEMPAPVICAVTGVALGGGFQIAMGADIRIIAPDARMSVLEIRWGLIPDMTGTQTLIQHCGLDVAKELTFSGRMVDRTRVCRSGSWRPRSPTRRYDDALAMAHEIAAKSPHAVQAAKRLMNNAEARCLSAERFEAERVEIGAADRVTESGRSPSRRTSRSVILPSPIQTSRLDFMSHATSASSTASVETTHRAP